MILKWKKRCGNICFAMMVVLCAGIVASFAETDVCGVIKTDAQWNPDNNPYIVTRDLVIAKQATLTITPGTVILICKQTVRDKTIPQLDRQDSVTVSIVVDGSLTCVGTPLRRILFLPQSGNIREPQWYGIVFRGVSGKNAELAYCDISGAYNGVSVMGGSPKIHHCKIELNNMGIVFLNRGDAVVANCVVVNNFTAGIRVLSSNPVIENSIVAFNRNNGVWGDGVSKINFEYNCVFGNADGNLLECDPELGVLRKKNDNKDSVDAHNNIFKNPVFAGSEYDSLAVENDVSLPTDRSKIKDTTIAKKLHDELPDSLAFRQRKSAHPPYSLSGYSPCLHEGNPAAEYKNDDGSRNNIGMYGGSTGMPQKTKKK